MAVTAGAQNAKTAARISQWQQRLLDLTGRNRLLNFRPTKTGTLRITEPDPHILFGRLVAEEKTLTLFLPDDNATSLITDVDAPIAALQAVQDGPVGSPIASEPAPLKPNEIRAEGDPRKHSSILYRLRLRARTSIEEQGVNTLFMAFGFLEWKESDASSEILRSPVLLVPVCLERESALEPYTLSLSEDEDIVLNPSLCEKLRRDFGIELAPGANAPQREWSEALGFANALTLVRKSVRRQPTWRVSEDAYLGQFSFLKLAMYKDLQAADARMSMHPLVRALAGDPSALQPPPDDLPVEYELDDKLQPKDTFHVLDADSSQLEVLAAATRGVSLIVQGPPGTGKSQTIVNLIAEGLAQHKKILFVSEKMAALEVVYRRLADCGLDTLCLEAHSHRANKRAVVEQLARALEDSDPGPPSPSMLVSLDQLTRRRETLNAYARALRDETVTPLGISVYQAHGELARRAGAPDLRFSLESVGTMRTSRLAYLLDCVEQLQAVGIVLLGHEGHPWRGCRVVQYSLQLQSDILTRFRRLRDDILGTRGIAAEIADAWGVDTPTSLEGLRWLRALLELLESNPAPPRAWLVSQSLGPLMHTANVCAQEAAVYRRRRQAFLHDYDEAVFALDLQDVHHRLTSGADPALRLLKPAHQGPAQTASAHQQALDELLSGATDAFEVILALGNELASQVGLGPPTTSDEISRLIRVLNLLLQDHRAPRSWLDRAQLLARQALARKAFERTHMCRVDGRALLEVYDTRLLQEAPAIAERFGTRYGGPLRAFRPSYWRDMGRLRYLHKGRRRHTTQEAANAVDQAKRVAEAGGWLDEHTTELALMFGEHRAYTGESTDWDTLLIALEKTLEILDELGSTDVPEELACLLAAGGPSLGTLRSPYRRLSAAWESLQHDIEGLEAFTVDDKEAYLGTALGTLYEHLKAWHAGLKAFWDAEACVRRLVREPGSKQVRALIDDVAEAVAIVDAAKALEGQRDALSEQFGYHFTGLDTDWEDVLSALDWTQRTRQQFAATSPPVEFSARVSAANPDPLSSASMRRTLENGLRDVDEGIRFVVSMFESEAFRPSGQSPEQARLEDTVAWCDQRLNYAAGLEEWLSYVRARDRCKDAGLDGFLADLHRDRPSVDQWADAFSKRFYQLWLDHCYASTPTLQHFRGTDHETIIKRFRELDRQVLRLSAQRVRHAVLSRRPPINVAAALPSEPAILRREIEKRRRHKPIRRLFREIPQLLLTLKPCLMMSPLSVSQYLDPDRVRFDLVIFDEASQVRPEDAAGAVFRAGRQDQHTREYSHAQVVVAGDSKQLPPTRFFEAELDEDAESEDEEVLESVLDEYTTIGLPTKLLRWHYRSRDERLIAFSNRHFYRHQLVTFPNPDPGHPERGVEFVHVPDGTYDRGGSRTNRVEAQRVVELIVRHAEQHPKQSLGVVAFSQAQMLAIHQELEAMRHLRRDLESFFNEDTSEPFFIKNLETVQGDERDVIFFSVGYGKDGLRRMTSSFGPLNMTGGERRLNVAITRARYHVKLAASILPTDIDLSHTQSEGVRLLRQYMEFAIQGPVALEAGLPTVGGRPDSPFEEAVGDALEERHLVVHRQVGCAGFRIDLAIMDETRPGCYLLGIECDGATYHSSKTARDRDRLRQQVLEGLGWRIHRIWSTDWVRAPGREIQRVLEALEQVRRMPLSVDSPDPAMEARAAAEQRNVDDLLANSGSRGSQAQVKRAADRVQTYAQARLPRLQVPQKTFYEASMTNRVIPELVEACVAAESPVHMNRVVRMVALNWGFTKVGERISQQIRTGIAVAVRQKKVTRRDDFLWRPDQDPDGVSVRVPAPNQEARRIEEVALEELAQAALFVVEEHFSLPIDSAIAKTARLLGYLRTGDLVAARLGKAIALLERLGKVINNQEMITLPQPRPPE
jgi:very-short-patch-repair endonuclease